MTSLIQILSKLAGSSPLVRRKTLEDFILTADQTINEQTRVVYESGLELGRTRKLLAEAGVEMEKVRESNRKLRETVLGKDNVGKFRGDFKPGHSQTSSTSRFGAKIPRGDEEPLVDSGSVAGITAVALRKLNEVILLQDDFEAMAMSAETLEFILAGEKWHVEFTRKVEN